jgi:hypothetical protein
MTGGVAILGGAIIRDAVVLINLMETAGTIKGLLGFRRD